MGKKSKNKCWLIQYQNLPTIELYAKTEGAAKTQAFRFCLQQKALSHSHRKDFMANSNVGILKTPEKEPCQTNN